MGRIKTDSNDPSKLVTSREPEGVKPPGSKGTPGDTALWDALLIVVIAWAILFSLVFSLRRFNV